MLVLSVRYYHIYLLNHPVQFLPTKPGIMYFVRKCWNYVRKEYRIFNLCFAIFTSYLLIDELKLYFIYKPTFTSILQTKLKPEHFPNILICSYPSYDLEELQSIGYDHSYDYSSGLSKEGDLIGWRGNNSDDNITAITQKLSVLRTVQDCPQIKAKFEQKGMMVKKTLSRDLSRAVYPNGRCCRVIIPDIARSNIVHRLYFRIYIKKYKNQNVNGFKMILSEPKSSSIFRQHEFSVDGDRLISPIKEVGYQEYKVKIKEEFHLLEDPNFICDNYNTVGQYDRCLEQEFVEQSVKILNCTPPWITENQSLWCHHSINVEEEISSKANFFFEHVIYGKAEDGKCKSSCKKTR